MLDASRFDNQAISAAAAKAREAKRNVATAIPPPPQLMDNGWLCAARAYLGLVSRAQASLQMSEKSTQASPHASSHTHSHSPHVSSAHVFVDSSLGSGFVSHCQALRDDFVSSRKIDAGITADDFARWLTCTRLHAATFLSDSVGEDNYAHAKAMDTERRRRMGAFDKKEPKKNKGMETDMEMGGVETRTLV